MPFRPHFVQTRICPPYTFPVLLGPCLFLSLPDSICSTSAMASPKTSLRFTLTLYYFLLILIFFSFHHFLVYSTDTDGDGDGDYLADIEELIAIDEQEEAQQRGSASPSSSDSEARVVSRAQKIVIELNHDNAQKVISENGLVMVMGYTPWCPRSAELMPHFAEAANRLKELGSPVVMAKIDAERYPKAASSLDIKGFPTLLLFTNGSSQLYTGGFTADHIVIWTRKKTGQPLVTLSSVPEAEEFVKKNTVFVVGLFDKNAGPYQAFVEAASSDNETQFVATTSVEIAKVVFPDIKPKNNLFLGLVRDEPEQYTAFEGSFNKEGILTFLEHNKFPLVTRLTELNSARVYSTPTTLQVYLFADSDAHNTLIGPLREVAKKFKSKIMFLYVNIKEDDLAKPLLNLLGLEDSEDTVVAAFDNHVTSKYLLEFEPTPQKIEEFCTSLLDGSLPQYFKSQPIPDNENATIKTVVGKMFDELVLNSPENVLLEVHTPWCMDCETVSKRVEKLVKHFEGLKNLIFAKIDASVNEHPKLNVDDYPALLFYPASDKSSPIKLSTKSSLKDLAIFIKNNVIEPREEETKDEL